LYDLTLSINLQLLNDTKVQSKTCGLKLLGRGKKLGLSHLVT